MKPTILLATLALAAVAAAAGTTYIEETFSDDKWAQRWVASEARTDLGTLETTAGSLIADDKDSVGLATKDDHRFYLLTTPLKETFDNSKEDLIIQYIVRQDRPQECGGAYLKLLPEGYDPKTFQGESEYNIMFGPDICGSENRVHVILNYKGKNYLTKQHIVTPTKDNLSHFFRLTVHPDQKYSLQVDGEVKADHVPIEDHWDIYEPRQIDDPTDIKPEDWVGIENKMIEDPTHVKPEGFDKPKTIPDPEAKQPEDWDTEADGDWVAPEIPNPEYEEWTPKYIPNPAYKGEWSAKKINNPKFEELPDLAHYKSAGVGFDLWQVKGGSIFDDIVVTSDADVAEKYFHSWEERSAKEKAKVEANRVAAEKAKKEEEEKKEQQAKEEEIKQKEQEEVDELDEEEDVKPTAPEEVEEVEEAKEDEATKEEEAKKEEETKEEEVKKEDVKKDEDVKKEDVKKDEEVEKAEKVKEEPKVEIEEEVEEEEVKEEKVEAKAAAEETNRHDEL
ncbi:hypothetical protein BGZ73_007744 [Actinomortierella ambigua]|nr:hypothetical protein BGZ73_007744 [Actinomortierella ambigua]